MSFGLRKDLTVGQEEVKFGFRNSELIRFPLMEADLVSHSGHRGQGKQGRAAEVWWEPWICELSLLGGAVTPSLLGGAILFLLTFSLLCIPVRSHIAIICAGGTRQAVSLSRHYGALGRCSVQGSRGSSTTAGRSWGGTHTKPIPRWACRPRGACHNSLCIKMK